MAGTEFKVNKDQLAVEIIRLFNAPINNVWQAHIDPELVAKWWGPRSLETVIETYEPVAGGKWRILHREPGGREHWFQGVFQVVEEPTKLVRTFVYEPNPNHIMTEACRFEVVGDGKTRLHVTTKFPSKEALDGMVNAGMEFGSRESLERLAELIERRI